MFRVGQRVVCIEDSETIDITKGNIYTVCRISSCSNCKIEKIDVGLALPEGYSGTTCYNCRQSNSDGIHWYMACRFAPLEEISDTTFDEIMEQITKPVQLIWHKERLN